MKRSMTLAVLCFAASVSLVWIVPAQTTKAVKPDGAADSVDRVE